MADDGLAYVKFVDDKTGMIPGTTIPKHKMGGDDGLAFVPERLIDSAVESAEDCP